ncbi:LysR family transcriptional regulator [Erythrobacter sp. 3-20A1M]|uniref:LysR family transcriptional regulator n=1 Tax=Erythrobacter sp. 3-20A1M TaxID=2653850 RepID=UPI001BFC1D42|nr:LysR family transcriptional regulator [Erythrobacter sp. 3-20A1M]QWC57455.1 LysR family transcriptional regulator [Erythrobacter sp. 3-20A1M]
MPTSRSDLADLTYFLAIVRAGTFRRAATELGVSPSALSHAMRGLEERLGVRLLNRTNRSVTLTAAGEELRDSVGQPFDLIDSAIERLNRFRESPSGRIRLNVVEDAAELLVAPVMAEFTRRYPDVELEILSSNRLVDIVADGYDAGIRFGGTIPEDMIARDLSAPLRWVVVAAPSYLEAHGTPEFLTDIAKHRCLRIRSGDHTVFDWELAGEDRGVVEVATPGQITLNESRSMLTMALDGVGLMYGIEALVRPHLDAGTLVPVLKQHWLTGDGFQIYWPGRRQVPTGLRLLVDCIRELQPLGL